MKNLRIAIIGAGTAGLAVAAFLKQNQHNVIVYEKFDAPKPLGAGLLIQPTGLSVLSLLGLDKKLIANGSKIEKLYGKVCGSRFATLDVKYKSVASHLFGVGVYRGHLFSALYEKALELGVDIQSSHEVTEVRPVGECSYIADKEGALFGPYDIVIDTSGSKSCLRKKHAQVKRDKPYPYGAIWSIVKLDTEPFSHNTLEQRYKNASHMIGLLPVGKIKGDSCTSAAFFWSLKVGDYDKWRMQSLSEWKDYVISLWPEVAPLVAQFKTHDDLIFASYSDVILKKEYAGNIIFMGDSAHCTSPQLGQGANLALMDAYVFSQCLLKADNVQSAFLLYAKRRKKHMRFYQMASRILTPFFQSDSWLFAKIRFLPSAIACKVPFTQKLSAHVLCGVKTGVFSTMNPGEWAKDYDLRKVNTL